MATTPYSWQPGERVWISSYPLNYMPDMIQPPRHNLGAVVISLERNGKLTIVCDDGIRATVSPANVYKGNPP
jgi:hypothetical protein